MIKRIKENNNEWKIRGVNYKINDKVYFKKFVGSGVITQSGFLKDIQDDKAEIILNTQNSYGKIVYVDVNKINLVK